MQEEGSGDNKVRFRSRRMRGGVDWSEAESRFVTGLVVFIAAALLYPWYAHGVQRWLAKRDAEAAAKAVAAEVAIEASRLEQQVVSATAPSAPAYTAPASIRLMGTLDLRDGPMAIVDLGGSPLGNAAPVICRSVEESLGTPTAGRQVRVQRWRRNAPAVSLGSIQC